VSAEGELVGPSVSWADGGRWGQVKIPGKNFSGGGRRGAVKGFSGESRRRLLRFLNSIDQGKAPAGCWRFVTLTYPATFPDPRNAKRDLDQLLKRFERAWGHRATFWKMEPQRRGAPHFHLLVMHGDRDWSQVLGGRENPADECTWWATNWAEVIGHGVTVADVIKVHMGQAGHGERRSRPCVEVPSTWGGVLAYVGKYLGKLCTFSDDPSSDSWHSPGRFWGIRRPELLPIVIRKLDVPFRVACKLRRAVVSWLTRQPSGLVICWTRTQRLILPTKVAEGVEVACLRQRALTRGEFLKDGKPFKRKWGSGGASVYLASSEWIRLCRWAFASEGLQFVEDATNALQCDCIKTVTAAVALGGGGAPGGVAAGCVGAASG